jgi:hypothetical protein
MTPQYIYINSKGSKFYYNDKAMTILHREDGPAFEGSNGSKEWRINGKTHREDGPAIEWSNGKKTWFLNGNRHREDGPAVEYSNGSKSWYLNDENLTEAEFLLKTAKETILTMDEIAAKFGIEVSKLKIAK